MARRPTPTLADYMAIAISPALIMGLVGSLAFFLLDLTYHGQYGDRLHWIMSWFVMAIVLIARIAIVEGGERASLFGFALAGAMLLAVFFLVPEYVVLAPFLLALTWWCAHELTWNCTWIDDDEDPGGEGLLQAAGLERADGATEQVAAPPLPQEPQRARPWWRRLSKAKRRHARAPGVTVVWFSLAALPIFGLGQLAIPAEDTARRQYAFWLATIYVGCGLGLLLNTAFLGLRRYLRRRGLEMPASISGGWLTLGGLMIAGLLLAGALLPRPSAEYSLAQVAVNAGKQALEASRFAILPGSAGKGQGAPGGEGPQSPTQSGEAQREGERNGAEERSAADQAGGQGQRGKHGRQGQGQAGSSGDASGKSNDAQGRQQRADSSQDQRSQGRSGNESGRQTGEKLTRSGTSSERSLEGTKGDSASQKEQGAGSETAKGPEGAQQRSEQSRGGSNAKGRGSAVRETPRDTPAESSAAARPPVEPPSSGSAAELARAASGALQGLGGILRFFKWILVAAAVCFFLWQFGPELVRMLRALAEWLRRLLGGQERTEEPQAEFPEEEALRRLSFSQFANPFLSGVADQATPEQLVVYTFAAMEAWGREAGLERSPDQTPLEFAAGLGERFPPLLQAAGQTAEFYTYLAYGPGRLTPQVRGPLEELWQRLAEVRADFGARA